MKPLSNIQQSNLDKLSLKSYFKTFEKALDKSHDVDSLTKIVTSKPYSQTKPYLTRRQLKPIDERFSQIELVYEKSSKVKAIVWELDICLSQLIELFGEPIIHNEPYSNTTAFTFRSGNNKIEIIKTRHSKWLRPNGNKIALEYIDENELEIVDPTFSFVQFNIKE